MGSRVDAAPREGEAGATAAVSPCSFVVAGLRRAWGWGTTVRTVSRTSGGGCLLRLPALRPETSLCYAAGLRRCGWGTPRGGAGRNGELRGWPAGLLSPRQDEPRAPGPTRQRWSRRYPQ